MKKTAILVVTGASGAGKTAAVQALEARRRPGIRCFYFDHIGVPSAEVMERDFGSGEGWQADATKRWISRLAVEAEAASVSILDGQTRPTFVHAALTAVDPLCARIVLLDCSPAIRTIRLAMRGQPELATQRMDSWAAYLRGQADALRLSVIDTSSLTVDVVADALEAEVEALRAEAGITW